MLRRFILAAALAALAPALLAPSAAPAQEPADAGETDAGAMEAEGDAGAAAPVDGGATTAADAALEAPPDDVDGTSAQPPGVVDLPEEPPTVDPTLLTEDKPRFVEAMRRELRGIDDRVTRLRAVVGREATERQSRLIEVVERVDARRTDLEGELNRLEETPGTEPWLDRRDALIYQLEALEGELLDLETVVQSD